MEAEASGESLGSRYAMPWVSASFFCIGSGKLHCWYPSAHILCASFVLPGAVSFCILFGIVIVRLQIFQVLIANNLDSAKINC
jgi:hypothetical protein